MAKYYSTRAPARNTISTIRETNVTCANVPSHARAVVCHVPTPGADQRKLCLACWRVALADDARAVVRQRFQALFRLRPLVTRPGGAVGPIVTMAAWIGAGEGRAL